MKTCKEEEVFRPSSIARYINCNLWKWLPVVSKSQKEIDYLNERIKDHERLEKENFTDSEIDCAKYFHDVKKKCDHFYKEKKLSMEIDKNYIPFEGTPDVYGFDEKKQKLYVLDYKTGRAIVDAGDNEQLLAYALLVKNNHKDWDIKNYELSILNTKHDFVSSRKLDSDIFITVLKTDIEIAVEKNDRSDLAFGKPGNWCHFCPSKRYCIRQKNLKNLVDYQNEDTDKLILETRYRQKEIALREQEVKDGKYSKLLSPLLCERLRRFWKMESLPEKFYVKKPMSITEAEKNFSSEEVEPFVEATSVNYFSAKQ